MRSEKASQVEVTLFNLTNGDEVMKGETPKMQRLSPIDLSVHYKRDMRPEHNSWLKFNETETVEAATQYELDRKVTFVNYPALVRIFWSVDSN